MNSNYLMMAGATAVLGLWACSGCVEREETIKIGVDGAVTIELEIEGGEEEISSGDAMPSVQSGWNVARSTGTDDDGAVHVTLRTVRSFGLAESLPHTFAAEDDPDADLYLEFPTTVRIEPRSDGVYYYFHRVYTPRRWGYLERWNDFLFDEEVKKLGEKPVEELTFEDRVTIAESIALMEAVKQLEFAQTAIEESHPDLPLEYGLMARRALIDYYTELADEDEGPLEQILRRCESLPEDQQDACFDEEAGRVLAAGYSAYMNSLRATAGLTPLGIAEFELAYDRAERYHNITERLGGHNFEIHVTMPGAIIAHNGLDDDVETNKDENTSTVEFEFDGKWFRDNTYELIVVSRLEHKTAREMRGRIDDSDK
jgi:hypothetical protein